MISTVIPHCGIARNTSFCANWLVCTADAWSRHRNLLAASTAPIGKSSNHVPNRYTTCIRASFLIDPAPVSLGGPLVASGRLKTWTPRCWKRICTASLATATLGRGLARQHFPHWATRFVNGHHDHGSDGKRRHGSHNRIYPSGQIHYRAANYNLVAFWWWHDGSILWIFGGPWTMVG